MGTMIQRLELDEAAVRGERFADHHKDLKNFSDILCLTHPEKITDIHRAYFEAGSDIVETNSFGASPVGMVEFDLPLESGRRNQPRRRRMCSQSGRRVDRADTGQASIRCRIDRTDHHATRHQHQRRSGSSRHDLRGDGRQLSGASRFAGDAGVDILLPETAIDTLNLKACLFAIQDFFDAGGRRVPVMASGTFAEGGRTFVSAQSVEAFLDCDQSLSAAVGRHELRLGPRCDAAAHRRAISRRQHSDQLSSQCRACPTRWASSISVPKRWRRKSASMPTTVGSTSSAVAAARRPTTSVRSPSGSGSQAETRIRPARSTPGCRGNCRW